MGEAGITEPASIEYPKATPFQSHHIKNRRTVFEELTRHNQKAVGADDRAIQNRTRF